MDLIVFQTDLCLYWVELSILATFKFEVKYQSSRSFNEFKVEVKHKRLFINYYNRLFIPLLLFRDCRVLLTDIYFRASLIDGSRDGSSHGSSHQEIGSVMSFNSSNTTASQSAQPPASPRQHGQPLMTGTLTMPQGHPQDGGLAGQTPQQLGTKVCLSNMTKSVVIILLVLCTIFSF